MNQRTTLWIVAIAVLLVGVFVAFRLFPRKDAVKEAKTAPSVVTKEDELTIVRLTPEAEKRLGIVTVAAREADVDRSRTYGAEVMLPPGRNIIVSAPINGSLKAPEGGFLHAGQKVSKGDVIFNLVPMLSPEGRMSLAASLVEAEGQIKNAKTQVEASRIAHDRAERLFKEEAGSKRMVDETQAALELARKTLEAAEARRDLLTQAAEGADSTMATPLAIKSPKDGVLRNVSAREGQPVPGGAVLFEVMNTDPVWVRVPVYVGEAAEVIRKEAFVSGLSAPPGAARRQAEAVEAPPTANPLAASVDLYFKLDNPDGKLIPGERVSASLKLNGSEKSLVVPWAAVIHDINGGTWVYESMGSGKYVRRRVQVRAVDKGLALLKTGPKPKTLVVTDGAAELFGTEVGFAK